MTDDTEKRYMGKRGPRKTRPRGAPPLDATVVQLFGEEEGQAAEERRKKTPTESPSEKPGTRVQKRRRKMRIGEKWTKIMDMLEATGMTMEEFCKSLSPEELARGQIKNEDGSFAGAPTKWVPSEFHRACIRELIARGKTLYQENYLAAIQAMTMLATNPAVEPKDRIKAAQFVIERIEGKVPDRLEIGAAEPWQEILSGIVADVPPTAEIRPFHRAE